MIGGLCELVSKHFVRIGGGAPDVITLWLMDGGDVADTLTRIPYSYSHLFGIISLFWTLFHLDATYCLLLYVLFSV